MPEMKDTGARVRAARAYAKLTLEQLGERTEIGPQVLMRIEQDRRRAKSYELDAIAKACRLPRSWFSIPYEWMMYGEWVSIPFDQDSEGIAFRSGGDLEVLNLDALSDAELDSLVANAEEVGARLVALRPSGAPGAVDAWGVRLRWESNEDSVGVQSSIEPFDARGLSARLRIGGRKRSRLRKDD